MFSLFCRFSIYLLLDYMIKKYWILNLIKKPIDNLNNFHIHLHKKQIYYLFQGWDQEG